MHVCGQSDRIGKQLPIESASSVARSSAAWVQLSCTPKLHMLEAHTEVGNLRKELLPEIEKKIDEKTVELEFTKVECWETGSWRKTSESLSIDWELELLTQLAPKRCQQRQRGRAQRVMHSFFNLIGSMWFLVSDGFSAKVYKELQVSKNSLEQLSRTELPRRREELFSLHRKRDKQELTFKYISFWIDEWCIVM